MEDVFSQTLKHDYAMEKIPFSLAKFRWIVDGFLDACQMLPSILFTLAPETAQVIRTNFTRIPFNLISRCELFRTVLSRIENLFVCFCHAKKQDNRPRTNLITRLTRSWLPCEHCFESQVTGTILGQVKLKSNLVLKKSVA